MHARFSRYQVAGVIFVLVTGLVAFYRGPADSPGGPVAPEVARSVQTGESSTAKSGSVAASTAATASDEGQRTSVPARAGAVQPGATTTGATDSEAAALVAAAEASTKGSTTAVTPGGMPAAGRRRPPIRAVLVSDTHSLYKQPGLIKVPAGDMLLFPGDVEVGSVAEGRAFSHWLQGLPIKGPRVITWGNMDTGTRGRNAAELVPGATVIVDAIQEVNGYRIFGSPWTPRFAGAYQLELDEAESVAFWSRLLPPTSDVDIILTHGPPRGIADTARGVSRGDIGLLKAVQALEKPPLLWVCGHIHEQYGEHRVPHPRAPGGSILLINSAAYYVQKPEHAAKVQPRVVALPEVKVVAQGA